MGTLKLDFTKNHMLPTFYHKLEEDWKLGFGSV